jgi:drug/metabolite transporter (DMT)-like permease
MLQNAGIARTSVSHAAVVVGAVPVLVALIAAGLGRSSTRPRAWAGYALALVGVAGVAGAGGAGATALGDLLVLSSAALSAVFIVVQPGLLAGRDPAAVTAVQLAAGAVVALPVAVLTEGAPPSPAAAAPVLALTALSILGTLLPFWLFAFGQSRVPAELAGAYMNLEPVVGAAVGWFAFGDAAALGQVAGAAAVLAGILLSTLPSREPAAYGASRSIAHPESPARRYSRRSWRRSSRCCQNSIVSGTMRKPPHASGSGSSAPACACSSSAARPSSTSRPLIRRLCGEISALSWLPRGRLRI